MRKVTSTALAILGLLLGGIASAQGMMGGSGTGSGSGMGMAEIAGDGSVLVTSMSSSMMSGNNSQSVLVDVASTGKERWRVTFTDGSPMMVTADGDLVVVVLVRRSMTGGPMMGGQGSSATDAKDAVLVGLSLANGAERFRTTLPGDMASTPLFAAGGAQLYLTVLDSGSSMMGSTSMRQGSSGAWNAAMKSTLLAVSRTGAVLWTLELAQGHMGM